MKSKKPASRPGLYEIGGKERRQAEGQWRGQRGLFDRRLKATHLHTDGFDHVIQGERTPSSEATNAQPSVEICPFQEHGNRIARSVTGPVQAAQAVPVQPGVHRHLMIR